MPHTYLFINKTLPNIVGILHKLCVGMSVWLSVITYSDPPTHKCPTLVSYTGVSRGHRGCVGYMYMGCATEGDFLAWFKLKSLHKLKFNLRMNLVNIVIVMQLEGSLGSGKNLFIGEVKIRCVKLPLWL